MADKSKGNIYEQNETSQSVSPVFTVSGQDVSQGIVFSHTSDRQNLYGKSVSWNWTPLSETEKIKGVTLVTVPVVFFVIAVVLMAFYGP